jgi:Ca-activated chloride channel family protein
MLERGVYLRALSCIALGIAALVSLAPGQTPAQDASVIRVNSNLVMVPVSVTDGSGTPVKDLTADDFSLEEDGNPHSVARMDEPGGTPLELALLFDVSGSIYGRFNFERQAASRFLREVLRPRDAVTIFAIGLRPRQVQERTTKIQSALDSLAGLEPTKEATAFFDSVASATHALRDTAKPGSRRVAIVVSDGEDNYSDQYQLEEVLLELHHADCIFYAINPSGPSIRLNKMSLRGQAYLERLASETGGAAFLPDRLEDLDKIFTRIAAELQAQYLLGYYSLNQRMDGKFRRIAVSIPRRPDLRVRARQGYYAARPS